MVFDISKVELHKSDPDPWWYSHLSPYFCPKCKGTMTWGAHLTFGFCDSCIDETYREYLDEATQSEW